MDLGSMQDRIATASDDPRKRDDEYAELIDGSAGHLDQMAPHVKNTDSIRWPITSV